MPYTDADFDELEKFYGIGNTNSNSNSNSSVTDADIDELAKAYGIGKTASFNNKVPASKQKSWLASGNVDLSKYTPPFLNNFEQGLIRGVTDVLATGGKGVAYLDKLLLPGGDERSKKYNEAIEAAKKEYEKQYGESTAASVGRIGGQTLATAPVIGVTLPTTGIAAGVGALPTVSATGARIAAPLANRLAASSITGALGGAEFGGLTQAATDESLPESVGKGAITGAIGGPLLTGAASAAKGLGRFVVGKISPETTALAKRAEELGIRLTPSQISDNQLIKKVEQQTGFLPFSGAGKLRSEQQFGINKAVSNTFGEDTNNLSSKLINKSLKKIGNEINTAAKNTIIDQSSTNALKNDLVNIYKEASKLSDDHGMKVLFNVMKEIGAKVDANGNMSGEAYNALTKYNEILGKAQRMKQSTISEYANKIRNALDDALERSATAENREAIISARRKYKAAKTVEDLIESDPEGNISPLKLLHAIKKAPGGKAGSGTLGEIADIGQKFFRQPPDSGTPLGQFVLQNLPTSTAGLAAIGMGHVLGGAVAGGKIAGSLAANRLLRAGITSRSAAKALVNMGEGSTSGKLDELTTKATPYLAPQTGKSAIEKEKKFSLPANLPQSNL